MRCKIKGRHLCATPEHGENETESFALLFVCAQSLSWRVRPMVSVKVKPEWDLTHDEVNSKKETAAGGPPSPTAATVISTGAKLGISSPARMAHRMCQYLATLRVFWLIVMESSLTRPSPPPHSSNVLLVPAISTSSLGSTIN
jgi:hypothetical protein